jgi:hypothetical protein
MERLEDTLFDWWVGSTDGVLSAITIRNHGKAFKSEIQVIQRFQRRGIVENGELADQRGIGTRT